MAGMFFNLVRAKQAKALMLHLHVDDNLRLKSAEYAVLRALAERMAQKTLKPRSRQTTPTIINTCFPSLDSIARDAAMSISTASRAIDKLKEKGLIEKEVIHNWKWKGRKDRTPKHNGVRYRLTPLWDQVPVVEYGHDEAEEEEEVAPPAAVSAEAMAEVDRVLAEDADFSPATRERGTKVTKEDADEVFGFIQHYYGGHPTLTNQSEEAARRSMNKACVELARRAIDLENIEWANYFLWWLGNRRTEVFQRLMNGTIKNLGVEFGLLKYVNELWEEFLDERDAVVKQLADLRQEEDGGGDDDGSG